MGANYRRACLAQSTRDFVAKLKTVEEEVDEAAYWLDLIVQLRLGDQVAATTLRDEAAQIRAMTTASIKTVRAKLEGP